MTNKKNNRKEINAWPKKELFLFEPKTLLIIIITSVLTLLIAFFGEQGSRYLTSVLSPIPPHAPFDGTVLPVKQVPNWVKLTEAERKAQYSALPADKLITIPFYNPSRLTIPTAGLKWNDVNDDLIRNEKITYSVPYLGNYKLDGVEGAGSHPAVDIKIPEGTPIYAIANGTVIKAEYSSGGFGNHIVLQHNDFPSLDDANKKETLYSSYNHLSAMSVKVNDVVTKGQLIGFSGSTGTATTPHLHFQIDNDGSSWHPYWPFTNAEMRGAGYSFFDAINNGFKRENAVTMTISPMKYVQKYFGDQILVASSKPELTQALAKVEDEYKDIAFVIQVINGTQFEVGTKVKVVVQAFDGKGNLLNKPKFKDEIKLSLLNGVGQFNRDKLTAGNLRTGLYSLTQIDGQKVGKDKVLLRFRDKEFSSPEFEIIEKKATVGGFLIIPAKTELLSSENVNVIVRAVDLNGNLVTDFALEEPITLGLTSGVGTLTATSLAQSNFLNGEAPVTLSASAVGSTEIFVGYKGQTFKSVNVSVVAPPAPVVVEEQPIVEQTPVTEPVVEPVAEVQPTEQISGTTTEEQVAAVVPEETPPAAEAPVIETPVVEEIPAVVETTPPAETIPVEVVGTTTPPVVVLPFSDVAADNKYFQALTELKAAGLVAGYADGTFKPEKEVSRAEAVTFILRALNEKIREVFATGFPDVNQKDWYFNFVATAFELGFVKGYPDGYFRPNSTVTFAEFLTMLFVGAKTDTDPQIQIALPSGVVATDWFAPYVQQAIQKNIIEVKDNAVEPNKPMTRGEIAEILYRIMKLEKEAF